MKEDEMAGWHHQLDGHEFEPEIKIHLLLGKKGVTKLDSVLKSRHYIAKKGAYSQSSGFSHSRVSM